MSLAGIAIKMPPFTSPNQNRLFLLGITAFIIVDTQSGMRIAYSYCQEKNLFLLRQLQSQLVFF